MTFLNGAVVMAMAAIAVPIIVHLQKRRKAKVVDWAAMQFLLASVASRRRGLTLEHLFLLLCRCLLVALFVLAMARPFVSSLADMRWGLALIFGILGLIAMALAVVLQVDSWKRVITAGAALVMLFAAVLVASMGDHSFAQSIGESRDVVIVIDGSASMKVEVNGQSNFSRAVDEARQLVEQLPGGSTVSLIAAGPVPRQLAETPQANLRRAAHQLDELTATGGATSLAEAIGCAHRMIEKGTNANKQIVLFSDNQLRPWQQAVDHAAEPWSDSESHVNVFGRTLKLPQQFNNISVVDLKVDQEILGIGRPLRISVDVLNSGTVTVSNIQLQLLIDGTVVASQQVAQLERESRKTLVFRHAFDSPGYHTLSGRITSEDHLADDNVQDRVVYVKSELPVLIVNGETTAERFQRPATFVQLALDPASMHQGQNPEASGQRLIRADVVDAAEFRHVDSLRRYRVIILCDVPHLPGDEVQRLGKFVREGGGLCILPGRQAEEDSYNSWQDSQTGELLMPAQLVRRSRPEPQAIHPQAALGIDFDTIADPSIGQLVQRGEHDLSDLQVFTHWILRALPAQHPAQVGTRLTNGDPLLVEHAVGRGRVMLLALTLDSLENNLVSRVSFPVLMHLWVYHLASANRIEFHHSPHPDLVLQLPATEMPKVAAGPIDLETPDGSRRKVVVEPSAGGWTIGVGMTDQPGVYRLSSAKRSSDPTNRNSTDLNLSFTVGCDPSEFDLTPASDRKLNELGKHLQIQWITRPNDLRAVAQGQTAGIELWKIFVVAAMAMIVIEVSVTRWVVWRRSVPSSKRASTITEVVDAGPPHESEWSASGQADSSRHRRGVPPVLEVVE